VIAFDELPHAVRAYVDFVSQTPEVPIELVGPGATRKRVLA
jgi:adenylosuccinate synthase